MRTSCARNGAMTALGMLSVSLALCRARATKASQMIIETSANELFQVRETGDTDLAHVWIGFPVKRVKGDYLPKAKARERLIRKAGARVVEA